MLGRKHLKKTRRKMVLVGKVPLPPVLIFALA
jgi:hypothetical protein